MNIKTSPPQDFSGLSQFANLSLAGLSGAAFNQTAVILTAFDTSSGYNWKIKDYWLWAVPLILTIPLFLVAGSVLRWSIQSAARYAEYWALPVWGGYPGHVVYFVINYIGLGGLALWRIRMAFRTRRERRVWSAFLVLLVVAVCLDVLFSVGGFRIFGLLPWAFLLWRWTERDRSP